MSRFESRVNDRSKCHPKTEKLMGKVYAVPCYHHYGRRTEKAYSLWIRWFIKDNGTRHPRELGKAAMEALLTCSAVERNVVASTRNQALNRMLPLYRNVLGVPSADDLAVHAKKAQRSSAVPSRAGVHYMIARMMSGGDLRLRVRDVEAGVKNVWLSGILVKKYRKVLQSWPWQYIFSSESLSTDPQPDRVSRQHIHKSGLQKAIQGASKWVAMSKRVTSPLDTL